MDRSIWDNRRRWRSLSSKLPVWNSCLYLYVLPDTNLHETTHKEFLPPLGKVGMGATHWETLASGGSITGARNVEPSPLELSLGVVLAVGRVGDRPLTR